MVLCQINERPYYSLQCRGGTIMYSYAKKNCLHPYVRISFVTALYYSGLSHATTCEALYCRGNIDKVSLNSGLHGDDATYSKIQRALEKQLILSRFQIADNRKAQ